MFAAAPHEPIPMDAICRILESSDSGITAIRDCGLINKNPEWDEDSPRDSHDAVATLHVHHRTREALRKLFPQNGTVRAFYFGVLRCLLYKQSCNLLLQMKLMKSCSSLFAVYFKSLKKPLQIQHGPDSYSSPT